MRRSIFFKVFGGYLLLILGLTALFFILSLNAIRSFYLNTLSRDFFRLGSVLKLNIVPLLEENRFSDIDFLVKNLGSNIKTRITVIDKEGQVLADSEKNPKLMENHKSRPEVYEALTGKIGKSLRFSTTVKEKMLYVGLPIEKNGQVVAVLRVSLYIRDINFLLARLRRNIAWIVLIITLISLGGAFAFSQSITRPIRKLRAASRRAAAGDFEAKVFLKSRDELKDLGQEFNFMTEQIKNLFSEITRQKEELNSILSSMEEGLLALDREDKILICNRSFQAMTETQLEKGDFYWERLRWTQFDDFIKKVRQKRANCSQEIELNQKIFFSQAVFLPSREEIVVTLRDITQFKKMERIKKDFVSNVSHELRTPLTAIKGFAETLEEEVGDKGQEYVSIIKRNTERLINIVKDLLLLAEVEEKQSKLELEQINIKLLITKILKIFEKEIKDKKLKLELMAPDSLPLIQGDPFRLEQMFINLIDNALRYTEKGKISIFLKKKEKVLSVEIQDTGVGIAEEHLPRIFERFYVVDKSRSKKLGGTGLGLAIVKHIALLHKAKIKVESRVGQGTQFIINFPLNFES